MIATVADTPGVDLVRFANEREQLLGRQVDLLANNPIRNPFLKRKVEATRQVVIDAPVA